VRDRVGIRNGSQPGTALDANVFGTAH
jgi:hypothetical protein